MATETREVKKKYYAVVKDISESDKCPPQARLIVDTIKAAGGRMSREDLLAALKRSPEEGGLKTSQTAERILGFYRPRLADMGVLKEEVETTTIEVEVPDKPAKEEKAATASADGAATGSRDKGRKGEPKTA